MAIKKKKNKYGTMYVGDVVKAGSKAEKEQKKKFVEAGLTQDKYTRDEKNPRQYTAPTKTLTKDDKTGKKREKESQELKRKLIDIESAEAEGENRRKGSLVGIEKEREAIEREIERLNDPSESTNVMMGGALPIGPSGAALKLMEGAPNLIDAATSMNNAYQSTMGYSKLSGTAGNLVPGKLVTIPSTKAAIAATNYAVTAKSVGLTGKILAAGGLSLGAISVAINIMGTYPFTSFGKEETLQSTGLAFNQAMQAGLYDEAQGILNISNEIINSDVSSKIPYVNTKQQFDQYAETQKEVNKVWQAILDDLSSGNSVMSQQYEEIQEKNEEKELEDLQWNSKYYSLIRNGEYEEADKMLMERVNE